MKAKLFFSVIGILMLPVFGCRTASNSSSLASDANTKEDMDPPDSPKEDKPIVILVKASIKDETQTPFLAALPDIMNGTRSEDGNLAYYPHQSLQNPTAFIFLEKWGNVEALMAHRVKPHTTAFFARIGTFLAGAPAGEKFLSVSGSDPRVHPVPASQSYVYVFCTFKVKDVNGVEAFLAAERQALRGFREEDGNMGFELYQSEVDRNKFVTYEIWADPSAAQAHLEGALNRKLLEATAGAIDGEVASDSYRVISL